MKKVAPEPQAIAADAAASLGHVSAAVAQARAAASADEAADDSSPAGPASGSARFLTALALLRELRAELATWEPDLIDAARRQGASWEQLAPALGVASRQAAERRYLRLRPS